MARKFVIELIDVPYLAVPNLATLDVEETAKRIIRARSGHSTKNYDANMKQIGTMVTTRAPLVLLQDQFNSVNDDAWRAQVKDVCERLYSLFGQRSATWYPRDRKPRVLFDQTLFKHAICGVWVRNGRATATAINARKTQFLDSHARAFLARGIEEFYLIDDPGLHDYNIIDLGEAPKSGARATRLYTPDQIVPMSLEEFEFVLRKFMMAVERAGFSARPDNDLNVADLFRRKG